MIVQNLEELANNPFGLRPLLGTGNKIPTGNGHKFQNAPQLWLGYSPPTSAIVSPNIMYMRDFELWTARRRSQYVFIMI